jgi:hypothetical protein
MEVLFFIAVIYLLFNVKSIKEKYANRKDNKHYKKMLEEGFKVEQLNKENEVLKLRKENERLKADIKRFESINYK